jgi:hypothetical protein
MSDKHCFSAIIYANELDHAYYAKPSQDTLDNELPYIRKDISDARIAELTALCGEMRDAINFICENWRIQPQYANLKQLIAKAEAVCGEGKK